MGSGGSKKQVGMELLQTMFRKILVSNQYHFMIFMPGIATGRRRSGAAPVARGHEPAAAERHPRRVSDLRQEIRQRQDTAAHGGE